MADNVLLVTVDSLRRDVFAESNGDIIPNIDALTRSGKEFSQAIANGPNTASSFPSILTGTHPLMFGGYHYMDENRPFIAESLREAGFRTVGYHSNPNLGEEKNFDNGFDVFNEGGEEAGSINQATNFVNEHLNPDSQLYSILRKIWHLFGSATGASAYERAGSITDNAIEWLSDWEGEQFFMWVHYMDVHYPFQPPDEHLRAIGHEPLSARRVASLNDAMEESPESLTDEDVADLKALYRGEFHYVDQHVGRLLDKLSESHARDDTMVVFTSDHGEAFGEHGRWGHHPYMYDELLRVPLIVDEPGCPSGTDSTQVSLIDLFPTICDACGVEYPENLQGENIHEKTSGVELSTSGGGDRLAARTPEWKCLWHTVENETELYNLNCDSGETQDVSEEYPDVVDRLKEELQDYRNLASSTDTELPEVVKTEEVKQRLRDLGYKD